MPYLLAEAGCVLQIVLAGTWAWCQRETSTTLQSQQTLPLLGACSNQDVSPSEAWAALQDQSIKLEAYSVGVVRGCVLALRWSLDKPFAMTEPPAEYKSFLSQSLVCNRHGSFEDSWLPGQVQKAHRLTSTALDSLWDLLKRTRFVPASKLQA